MMNMPIDESTLERPVSSTRATTKTVTPLPTPDQLRRDFPVSATLAAAIASHREAVRRILNGRDNRMLIVVGPCSIHDEVAALEYGERLAALADTIKDRCLVVMRAYVEKPRTTVGWKGLLYDPERTGQGDLAQGLMRSRRLLLNLAELGLPLATEALNPLAFSYLEDLICWTAVGARTTESQIHREMASGLPMPVGFKNGTDGTVSMAVNAIKSATHSHHQLATGSNGEPAMLITPGNPDAHLVLRGGRGVTNYDAQSIAQSAQALASAGLASAIIVDCSHDNACKQADRQPAIAREVVAQRYRASLQNPDQGGAHAIRGIMLESFLEPGRQSDAGQADEAGGLVYGKSITDPCLGWSETEQLLLELGA